MPSPQQPLELESTSDSAVGQVRGGRIEDKQLQIGSSFTEQEYVPPNGGYGWVCVVCVFLINTHTWGLSFAYGVFLDYFVSNNVYPNATALDYAFIGGLSFSQALIVSPITNTTSRIWGTRATLTVGLVLLTASLIGASFAAQVWHLFLSQGVCYGWGIGFLYVGSANIIPQWFSTRRSLANGICSAGAGFGGLIYSLAAGSLLERAGPPTTFRVLAACEFVTNLACIILVKDRNHVAKQNQTAFHYQLLKRKEIWLVLGWGFLSELGYTALMFTLPNYARRIGLSAHQGSIIGALLNLGLMVGRPIVGHWSDALGRINIATFTTGICGFMCLLIWIFAKNFASLSSFAVLAGTVCGTFWGTVAPIGAEVAGLKDLPSTLSIVLMLMTIPTTFAEPVALSLRRSTGDIYLDAQIFTGFMFIGASICTLFLRSWKIGQNEMGALAKRQREHEGPLSGVLQERNSRVPSRTSTFQRLFQLKVV